MTEDDAPARDAAESADARDARPVPHPDRARRLAGDLPGGPVARAPAADRRGRDRDGARRLGAPRRRRVVRPGAPVVHAGRAPLRESMARIVGAQPVEVALLNSLTVDIHLLLASFFRPDGRRRRILADGPLFPSDRHALTSHLAQRGLDPATDLVVIGPRDRRAPRPDRRSRDGHRRPGRRSGARLPGGVNFATGQALDIERLTAAGHAAGAVVGWDLAHAAGNVELALHDWDVDFAAWCTYKYLNGGPGSVGAIFVHERHAATRRSRVSAAGGDSIRTCGSTRSGRSSRPRAPPAGRPRRRRSSRSRRSPLRWRSSTRSGCRRCGRGPSRSPATSRHAWTDVPIEVITPRDPAARGAQLSLRHDDAKRSSPGSPRAASWPTTARPTSSASPRCPLYTTFEEIDRFVSILRERSTRQPNRARRRGRISSA